MYSKGPYLCGKMYFFFPFFFSQEIPINPEVPSSVSFLQLETDTYKIIFPPEATSQAFEIADLLFHYGPQIRVTNDTQQVSIVIHPYMASSNAFVTLLPRRSIFFTQPYMSTEASDFGVSLTWNLGLSVHEYQHFEQQDRSLEFGAKLPYVLFGETGWGVLMGISQPSWFMEGEAVQIETRYTPSGRGDTFGFLAPSLAVYEEYGLLNYPTSYFGSFNYNIMDHYRIGWLMTHYGTTQYGDNFWGNISRQASLSAFRFFPFDSALRNTTGNSMTDWYQKSVTKGLDDWTTASQSRTHHPVEVLFDDPSPFPARFNSPTQDEEGKIMAFRRAFDNINTIVEIDNLVQTNEIRVGGRNATNIGRNNNWVVWDSLSDHPFNSGQRYSELYAQKRGSNKKIQLTHKGYFFSPNISEKNQVVSVHNTPSGVSSLAFLSLDTDLEQTISFVPVDQGNLYDPQWINESSILVIRRELERGNILCRYDIERDEWTDLGEWTWSLLSHPTANKEWIFLVKSHREFDEIIAHSMSDNSQYQVAVRPFGVRDPSVNTTENTLVFSEIIHSGSRIVSIPIAPETWRRIEDGLPAEQLNIPTQDWETRPYRSVRGLFKPYYWWPNLELANSNLGFSLLTQDVTGQWQGEQKLIGNVNHQGVWGASKVSYTRFWPDISIEARYGKRTEQSLSPATNLFEVAWDDIPYHQWIDKQALLILNGPITFSNGVRKRQINLMASGGIQGTSQHQYTNDFPDQELEWPSLSHPFHFEGQFINTSNLAALDLLPKFGQILTLGQFINLTNSEAPSYSQYGSIRLFFPGLFSHHSLSLYGSGERRLGPNPLPYQSLLARGFASTEDALLSFRSSYRFPMSYPDWTVGRLLFVKRVRGAFFGDQSITEKNRFTTVGATLVLDTHLMRFPIPIPLGLDIGYMLDAEQVYIGPNLDIMF